MLSEEIRSKRRSNVTASSAHKIMTGWDDQEPSSDFPLPVLGWIETNDIKPSVGQLKDALGIDVTGKDKDAAWKMYQFNKPSQGLITYAEELACQELFRYDPMMERPPTQHMINGNERELEATIKLSEATGLDFVNTGDDQVHISLDGVGATPDGLVYNDLDLIETGCEVKSRSDLHHARQVFIDDNDTLLDLDFDRFCQMQVGCFVTGAEYWYSASFNPMARYDGLGFNYCIMQRDNRFLDVFKKRVALTFEYKQLFIDNLLSKTNTEAA